MTKNTGSYMSPFHRHTSEGVALASQTRKVPVHLLVLCRGAQVTGVVEKTFCRVLSCCVSSLPKRHQLCALCTGSLEQAVGHPVWLGRLLGVKRDTPACVYCYQCLSFVFKNQRMNMSANAPLRKSTALFVKEQYSSNY